MLGRLFRRNHEKNNDITLNLYEEIVAASRQTKLYSDWGAPDTPLGRFELISLHMVLFQRRLAGNNKALADIAQEAIDYFFMEVDHSLRELGVGDVTVPKRMKRLAKMFYGRASSYAAAIDGNDVEALTAALERNIWPDKLAATPHDAAALARYVLSAGEALAQASDAGIEAGKITFIAIGDVK